MCVCLRFYLSHIYTHSVSVSLSLSLLSPQSNRNNKQLFTVEPNLLVPLVLFCSPVDRESRGHFHPDFWGFHASTFVGGRQEKKTETKETFDSGSGFDVKGLKKVQEKGWNKERKKATNIESLIWLSFFPPALCLRFLFQWNSCFSLASSAFSYQSLVHFVIKQFGLNHYYFNFTLFFNVYRFKQSLAIK